MSILLLTLQDGKPFYLVKSAIIAFGPCNNPNHTWIDTVTGRGYAVLDSCNEIIAKLYIPAEEIV